MKGCEQQPLESGHAKIQELIHVTEELANVRAEAVDLKAALADVKKIGFKVVDQDKTAAIAVIEDPKGGWPLPNACVNCRRFMACALLENVLSNERPTMWPGK